MPYSSKQILNLQRKFQKNPKFFSNEVIGGELWDKQIMVMESVKDNPFTIVRSGHGVGKTHVAAKIVLWFLSSFYPSKVITTAPTWMQVKAVLWEEINKLYKRSKVPLGGELLLTQLKMTDDHFAIGFSTDDPDKFQGHHSENILVVFDEAPGVRADIWEAAQGLLTSPNSRFLAIGNPTAPHGPFYDAFKNSLYNKIAISCLECPNVVHDKIIYPGLVTKEWIEQRRTEWGEISPLFKARVLGEFPVEGEDTLIPLSWVERAMEAQVIAKGKKSLGIDVARYGSDHTVFVIMHGNHMVHLEGYQGKDLTKTTGKAIDLHKRYKCDTIVVDDTGVGGGVTDMLQEQDYPVQGINFGSTATDADRFDNLKTEIFWNLRDDFENNKISIQKHDRLLEELPSIMYEMTSRGKMKIVSKDKMKKMGIKSPDYADALAIAHSGTYSRKSGLLDFYKEDKEKKDEEKNPLATFLNRPDIKGNIEGL